MAFTCVYATGAASANDNKPSEQEANSQTSETGTTPAPSTEAALQDPELDANLTNQLPPGVSASQAKALYKRMHHKALFGKLQYYFVGQNASNCDFLYGVVVDNSLIGRASVRFTLNGCQCHGVAQVTHVPLFGGHGNAGQRGYVKARCSDKRSFKGSFTTTSLTTGDGTLSDNLGNQYQFTFGHTAEEALKKIDLLREQLHCPEVTAKEIELKVEGQVLPRH